jgi:putative flippase GtrA
MIISNPDERGRFLRFALVGAIGAVVDFGTFNLMVNVFRIPTVSASVISFIAAVLSNFLWNRFWTYPDSRSKKIPRQIAQFSLVSIVGLGIRTPLFVWLEKILIRNLASTLPKNFFLSSTFVGHNLALAVAILVVMMWNFYANRMWTYNDVD